MSGIRNSYIRAIITAAAIALTVLIACTFNISPAYAVEDATVVASDAVTQSDVIAVSDEATAGIVADDGTATHEVLPVYRYVNAGLANSTAPTSTVSAPATAVDLLDASDPFGDVAFFAAGACAVAAAMGIALAAYAIRRVRQN